MLASAPHAHALNPGWRISQYGHTAWRIRDGAFPGTPHVITQTRDGYLWIGTESALIRFDGVRFTPWAPPPGETLPGTAILSLLGARDGGLWIGTDSGLAHWKNQHLTVYPGPGRINDFAEDREGGIWLARSRIGGVPGGPLCRVNGDQLHCYDKAEGISFREQGAEHLITDGQDGFWVGSVRGVCHWTPHSSVNYFPKELEHADGEAGVSALRLEPDGSLLVSSGAAGIRRLVSGVWSDYRAPGFHGAVQRVESILRDRDGGLWIATAANGIAHLRESGGETFGYNDGLSSDTVDNLFEDREGDIWAVSSQGVDRFRDIAIGTISKREGLSEDNVETVLASRTGEVWVGNGLHLDTLQGRPSFPMASKYLSAQNATSLLQDTVGRIWVGAGAELTILENGRTRNVRRPDGTPLGVVFGLAEDSVQDVYALVTGVPAKIFLIRGGRVAGSVETPSPVVGSAIAADPGGGVWFGFRDGSLRRLRSGRFETAFPDVAGRGAIRNLFVDGDGSVFGASARGLVRLENGTRRLIDKASGLMCDQVFSVIRDNSGTVWLSAACGIMSIAGEEMKRWWAHPDTFIRVRLFDALDGAQTGMSPFGPVVSKAPDGRLWFVNDATLQFVDPAHTPENRLPPPVYIEQVVADGNSSQPLAKLRLPAHTRNLQINYTAPSFVMPERVRFRYRLDGRDKDWQEPATRREAFYDDLPPGTYRFRVIACNNSGLWNETGDSWDFSVAPAWYQTTWFRSLAVSAFLAMLWLLYQLRVRQIAAAMNARFDERVAERNRLAGELHDTILQTVQATKLIADNARLDHSDDPAHLREAIGSISAWLAQATAEARAALNALHTSVTRKNDLGAAFERTAEAFRGTSPMSFIVSVEGEPRDLHPIVRDEIYRIGSEAIRNAYLHSHASRLEVSLSYTHTLTLRVRDDGDGMERELAASGKPGHFGLPGMQNRAVRIHGTLRVLSRSGAGTEIELIVPGTVAFERRSGSIGKGRTHG